MTMACAYMILVGGIPEEVVEPDLGVRRYGFGDQWV